MFALLCSLNDFSPLDESGQQSHDKWPWRLWNSGLQEIETHPVVYDAVLRMNDEVIIVDNSKTFQRGYVTW